MTNTNKFVQLEHPKNKHVRVDDPVLSQHKIYEATKERRTKKRQFLKAKARKEVLNGSAFKEGGRFYKLTKAYKDVQKSLEAEEQIQEAKKKLKVSKKAKNDSEDLKILKDN